MTLRGRRLAVLAAGCAIGAAVVLFSHPGSSGAATRPAVPTCPPDCGAVAAGDPLLTPYVVVNPGPGWLSFPSSAEQSYVEDLRHNLDRRPATNLAAARWTWVTGRYQLLDLLVASSSVARAGFASPLQNASHLCTASHGTGRGRLSTVPGIPGSVLGICLLPRGLSARGAPLPVATVVAFRRANVAVLMEVTSRTGRPIDVRTVNVAAQQQFLALPPGGVLVSDGFDGTLVVLWLLVLGVLSGGVALAVRRAGGAGEALRAAAGALRRRRWALGVSAVAVVGAMAFSMLDSSVLHGTGQWYESGFNDFWRSWGDGITVTYGGGLGHLYGLDRALETAPAFQVLIAPVARLAAGLPYPHPSPVLYPAAFWVAGPLYLACTAFPICAGERFLDVLGVTDLRRRLLVLGTMAVVLPPMALFGHAEDLLALGAALYGLHAAMERRPTAVGWWLGVALAFQLFAFLAVPLALVFLDRRTWLRALVPMALVPLAFLAVPLVTDPTTTLHQLAHQQVYWDHGYVSPTWDLSPGVAAFVRAGVAVGAVPAALLLARFRPRGRPDAANVTLWVLALLFALRVVEPELVPYYLAPTLALLPLCASRRSWPRLGASCAVAIWLNWWVHVAVHTRWSLWLLLAGQLVVLAALAAPGRKAWSRRPAAQSPPRRTGQKPPAGRSRAPARSRTAAAR